MWNLCDWRLEAQQNRVDVEVVLKTLSHYFRKLGADSGNESHFHPAATEESEIDHLRQALNQGHYLKVGRAVGFSDYSAKHMSEKMPRLCHAG